MDDSGQDPDIEISATEAPLEVPPGSPLPTQSLGSVTSCSSSSTEFAKLDFQGPGDYCSRMKYLESQGLGKDGVREFFLLDHFQSDHPDDVDSCDPLPASSADQIVQNVPIREEIPLEQVHCIQLNNLMDELLGPRHIRPLKLFPPIPTDLSGDIPGVRVEAYQACLDHLTTINQPLFAATSYVCGDQKTS